MVSAPATPQVCQITGVAKCACCSCYFDKARKARVPVQNCAQAREEGLLLTSAVLVCRLSGRPVLSSVGLPKGLPFIDSTGCCQCLTCNTANLLALAVSCGLLWIFYTCRGELPKNSPSLAANHSGPMQSHPISAACMQMEAQSPSIGQQRRVSCCRA